jgi:tetratricopeptide (TPR) repeat protein
LQNTKGKEQEALKNFNEALAIDPDNVVYLQDKAATHLSLFTDYQLPPSLAEKHRDKGETSLLKVVSLIEGKENASYREYQTVADVSTTLKNNVDAKKYYIKAVNAFEKAEEVDQNMNIFKDIIKAQKACVKLMAKYTEF